MTTIKQAMVKTIKNYLEDGGYYNYNGSKRLYADTQNCFGIPNSIQLQIVAICAKEICPNPLLDPNLLISVILNPMGIVTGPNLVGWLDGDWSMFNTQGYADILNPPVPDLGEMREISVYEARQKIRTLTGIHPFDIYEDDMIFRLIKPEMIKPVCVANPADRRLYIEESHDCDDFVNETTGWLSRWNYGNLVFGKRSDVILRYEGQDIIKHAITHILDDNMDLWMYDPQVETFVWKYGEKPPYSKYDEIRILRMTV